MPSKKIILYSLSTCGICQAIKKMFDDLELSYHCIQADELSAEDKKHAIKELRRVNPKCSFPTVILDDEAIVGYKVQELKEKIGIRTEVDDLYDLLKKINEPKGCYLNGNKEKTFELIRGLLTNKKRYGYMACPCRLASGVQENDSDIICPCVYRKPDVAEYGSCFYSLYSSLDSYQPFHKDSNRLSPVIWPDIRAHCKPGTFLYSPQTLIPLLICSGSKYGLLVGGA